jgi:hypothetical protein
MHCKLIPDPDPDSDLQYLCQKSPVSSKNWLGWDENFLQSLITAAHESNVDFYYALSPGLDITYSNSKEVLVPT